MINSLLLLDACSSSSKKPLLMGIARLHQCFAALTISKLSRIKLKVSWKCCVIYFPAHSIFHVYYLLSLEVLHSAFFTRSCHFLE